MALCPVSVLLHFMIKIEVYLRAGARILLEHKIVSAVASILFNFATKIGATGGAVFMCFCVW